ncbi:hypothetical protein [Streptomyces sp. NPDC057675]
MNDESERSETGQDKRVSMWQAVADWLIPAAVFFDVIEKVAGIVEFLSAM